MPYSRPIDLLRHLLEGPVTRPALMRWRHKQFLSADGFASYSGVFHSFEQARQSLPDSPEFDEEALTQEYVSVRTKKVFAYDYPVLWWLAAAFRNGGHSVLDIGGSVGVHYYAYQQFLELPKGLKWTVAEVPSVARVGERLASEQQSESLVFCTDLDSEVGRTDADVWMAAGSLQYLEHPSIPRLLRHTRRRPRHMLLNKLPLYDGEPFVTTQNLGEHCYAPVHVFNRNAFINSILAEGYVLRDEWPVHERSLYLPGFGDRSFSCFSGLYFVEETSEVAAECLLCMPSVRSEQPKATLIEETLSACQSET